MQFQSLREPSGDHETSKEIAARVLRIRERQIRRQGGCNAGLDNAAVERHCTPNAAGLDVLERAMQQLGLSARGYHRVLKVARTIADMGDRAQIEPAHVSEALALRSLDRQRAAAAT